MWLQRWSRSQTNGKATKLQLPDGRQLSYLVRGNTASSNAIFWLHGIVSSRFESLAAKDKSLEALDAFVVSIDRPGYGESSVHRQRNYKDFAQDVQALADSLSIKHFSVLGVSGGGPYALACASFLPQRVQGVLLISSAGWPGWLTDAELARALPKNGNRIARLIRKAGTTPRVTAALSNWGETYIGARILFRLLLRPLTERSIQAMSEVDQNCLRHGHPEYLQLVRPESLRQGTATGFLQDLRLYCCPWEFQLSDIPEALQRRIHIWHGTGDLQVSDDFAHAFKRQMPEAGLHIVDNGGHFKYFVCDEDHQYAALSALVAGALPASG